MDTPAVKMTWETWVLLSDIYNVGASSNFTARYHYAQQRQNNFIYELSPPVSSSSIAFAVGGIDWEKESDRISVFAEDTRLPGVKSQL